jgi:hypothetical protein
MAVQINYEDNIFYLTTLIRNLKNGTMLDIDADIFKDKFIEDILFINSGLQKIYKSLSRNAYLIRRNDYLRSLHRAKQSYVDFVDEVLAGSYPFCEKLSSYSSQFNATKESQLKDMTEIHSQLMGAGEEKTSVEDEDVVSQEEYRFLFKEDEEKTT